MYKYRHSVILIMIGVCGDTNQCVSKSSRISLVFPPVSPVVDSRLYLRALFLHALDLREQSIGDVHR